MVLGLVNFLLGGKQKKKVSRSGQVSTMSYNANSDSSPAENSVASGSVNVPDGVNVATANTTVQTNSDSNEELSFQPSDNSRSTATTANSSSTQTSSDVPSRGGKVSDVINKIYGELKSTNERVTQMVSDMKKIETTVNTLGHRIDELEEEKKTVEDKLSNIDSNMTKFLSLYELINNQYNPFVEKEDSQKIMLDGQGNSVSSSTNNEGGEDFSFDELKPSNNFDHSPISIDLDSSKSSKLNSVDNFLELDTLNIEEAASDAVPLVKLKNNTNSLVTILSWLEYLIKRVGSDEARNTLRYYTETLKWITPEVFFDLDKYLRGMKDKQVSEGVEISVKDHIVSLYFISKLNEKRLDDKLTQAVLQIIKDN